jgi:hypothetical protein
MRAGLAAASLPPHPGEATSEEDAMPKTSKATASETVELEGFEAHYEKLDRGYTAAFERYTADSDPAEFFRGLPDDRCQCPHWGYVLSGRVTFRYPDREETYEAGDAYYAPPGHTPVVFVGTELVEFSPTDGHDETTEVIVANTRTAGLVS